MREIKTMKWPDGLHKFIHMSDSCEISVGDLEKLISRKVNDISILHGIKDALQHLIRCKIRAERP